MAYARITADELFDGEDYPTRVGTEFVFDDDGVIDHTDLTERHEFVLTDDDGIDYYRGHYVIEQSPQGWDLESEIMEYLFAWGMADAGTTELSVDGETVIS